MEKEKIRSYINKIKLLGAEECNCTSTYYGDRRKIDIREIYELKDSLIAIAKCYGATKIIKIDRNTLLDTDIKLRHLAYKSNNEEVSYVLIN